MGARSWSTPSPPPPPAPPGPLLPPCTSPSSSPPVSPLPTPSPVTYQQYQRKRQQHHHSARSKTAQHPQHPHHPAAHVGYQQITDLPLPLPAHVYPAGPWPSSATIPVGGGHPQSDPVTVAAVVTQQLERHLSVRQDLALDLPPCLPLPDGEERPYGASTRLRIRDYDQESEIYRECIRPPPNRTVYESGEPALIPFRCNSVGILSDASVCTKPSPTSTSSPSSLAAYGTAVCGGLWDKDAHLSPSSRVVLDINGLPVVMRSKSMSTGSSGSLVHSQHPQHPQQLAVMVPVSAASGHKRQNKTPAVNASPPLASSSSSSSSSSPAHAACPDVRKDSGGKSASLEAAVKSFCVRSFFRDKVSSARTEAKCSPSGAAVTPAQSAHPPLNAGVDNAAFESSCGQVSVSLSDARFRQPKHKHPDQSAAGRSSAPKPPETHRPVRQQSTASSSSPAASAGSCSRCRKTQHPPPPPLTGSDSGNSSSSRLASLHVVSCLTFNHGEAPPSPQT